MDDIAGLQPSERIASYVRKAHELLLKRADLILVTSQYLLNGIDGSSRRKACLVRNAFKGGGVVSKPSLSPGGTAQKKIRFGYVGTISAWMDLPLLLESLERFDQIEYHLWGPVGVQVPEHERVIVHGVIEHDRIADAVRDIDCLIMPFQVNDIVLAVDPEKMYEYISFGKNILSVYYPEVDRFRPLCVVHKDREEFFEKIDLICKGELPVRYSASEQ